MTHIYTFLSALAILLIINILHTLRTSKKETGIELIESKLYEA